MMLRALFIILVSAIAAVPPAKAQLNPGRFQLDPNSPEFTPAAQPGMFNQQVQVMVKMSVEPVALIRARAPGKLLSASEAAAAAARVHAQHVTIESDLRAAGAHVVAHLHHAYNGIHIFVDRSQIAKIAALPGVVAVLPVRLHPHDNATTVPFIGAPRVWGATPGFRGEAIKIGMIDTGVDYTHADFGGSGLVTDYQTALANDTTAANPLWFGPAAPKVKGGTDLVGDAYTGSNIPVPDPNPLDCASHGTHTAGTAAGFGVNADGTTYTGPYNASIYTPGKFKVGPGVAPGADLYAIKVFGCAGSTGVVAQAIDWATANNLDVISMSLGSPFGTADDPDTEAAENAAKAGIMVVASSGNSGSSPYILGTPSSGDAVISVAATDATAGFAGAKLALNTGTTITVQNSNGAVFVDGTVYSGIVVLRNTGLNGEPSDGPVSLGCKEADWNAATNGGVNVTGKLVVALRGAAAYCDAPANGARVFRAGAGQKYGATAVVLLNNNSGYPPVEGPIPGGNPATNPFGPVTIPFFGVKDKSTQSNPSVPQVLSTDAAALVAAASATATNFLLPNPGFRMAASFTSGGPRFGDSILKPGLTAPGVAVVSAGMGTGTNGFTFSGTSMSCPHVAGVAALVKQAHPNWSVASRRAAILQTASPTMLADYTPRIEGAGLVQPVGATLTQAVVGSDDDSAQGLSFGFAETLRDYHASRTLQIHNHGHSGIQFQVTVTQVTGNPGVLVTPSKNVVWVGPRDDATLTVTLQVPGASIPATHDQFGNDVFADVSGYITLTPASATMNNGVSLNLPYYLVPRVRSNADVEPDGKIGPSRPAAQVRITNHHGGIYASPDFYSWGLSNTPQGVNFFDTRAVGMQSIPAFGPPGNPLLVVAINTFPRFSNPAAAEFDVPIWTTSPPSGAPDFVVIGADHGAVTTGSNDGILASFVLNNHTHTIRLVGPADAPTDGSTVLLPFFASQVGLTAGSPRFTYSEATFNNIDGGSSKMPTMATFNAFTPSIATDTQFLTVNPDSFEVINVTTDPVEFAKTPALGLMIVDPDNRSGAKQAQLIPAQ